MKQLGIPTEHKDPVKEVRKKEEEKQEKYLGSMKPHKGHKTFKYDTKTGELTEAKFEEDIASFVKKDKKDLSPRRRRIIAEKECIYVSALNIKNAVKRLAKYHNVKVKF